MRDRSLMARALSTTGTPTGSESPTLRVRMVVLVERPHQKCESKHGSLCGHGYHVSGVRGGGHLR